MVSQRLNVMRSNEPLLLVFDWHLILNVLQVVIRRQIEIIRSCDIVIDKLSVIFDQTEALIRIILLARFNIDEMLLDILGLLHHLLLFFKLFIQFLFISDDARFSLA